MPVLFQYAFDDGAVQLWEVWKKPVHQTMALIESVADCTVVGFNLAFDWFHVNKLYTIWRLCDPAWIPEEHIEEIALLEPKGRDEWVIKPRGAMDLMLFSRKGPYQSLMARADIRIRKVPAVLADALADELEKRIEINGIYFARSKDPNAPRWTVDDRKDQHGEYDEKLKDVTLRFKAAGGLKPLTEHALGIKPKAVFKDIELDRKEWGPYELGYAPFALAVSKPEDGWFVDTGETPPKGMSNYAWPAVIWKHIEHWNVHEKAREYATDDVIYTRMLDEHFGCPEPDDDDSTLACMVGIVRWRGYRIDVEGIKELKHAAELVIASSPVNINAPRQVRSYLLSTMDEMEAMTLVIDSTSKKSLKKIVEKIKEEFKITADEPCGKCDGDPKCRRCGGSGVLKAGELHPTAAAAEKSLAVRTAMKERELYVKLLIAGRFHASFKVIGTLSSRMSGSDGLNPQGIKKTKNVRSKFPLTWDGYVLCGGDFDSFEVTLADADYQDPALRKALVTKVPCHVCNARGQKKECKNKKCKGWGCGECAEKPWVECDECDGCRVTTKKIHALFAMEMYPGKTYEDIMASDGTDDDMYTKGKIGVFTETYGGNWSTLMKNLSIPEEIAKRADEGWIKTYPGIGEARKIIEDQFCSMRQPRGVGSQVYWHDPSEYVITFLGFKRYFTLENKIVKALYDLATRPPTWWRKVNVEVVRHDRTQKAYGAVGSALFAAAFGLQSANMRAAANHRIQSPGGEITKRVQRRIWDQQPVGPGPLMVAPMNIHDEIQCPTHPSLVDSTAEIIRDTVNSYRAAVPLIGMTWFKNLSSWADKKSGKNKLRVRASEMETSPEQAREILSSYGIAA
jgi:hypothetical protein